MLTSWFGFLGLEVNLFTALDKFNWPSIIKSEFVNNVKTPSWQHLKKGYSATKKRQLRLGKIKITKPKKPNVKEQALQMEMPL